MAENSELNPQFEDASPQGGDTMLVDGVRKTIPIPKPQGIGIVSKSKTNEELSKSSESVRNQSFPDVLFSQDNVMRSKAATSFFIGMGSMVGESPFGKGFQKSMIESVIDTPGTLLFEAGGMMDEGESTSELLSSPRGLLRIAASGPLSIFSNASVDLARTTDIDNRIQRLGKGLQDLAANKIKELELDPQYSSVKDKFLFDLGAGTASVALSLGLAYMTANPALPALYFGGIQKAQTFKEMTRTANVKDLKTGKETQMPVEEFKKLFVPELTAKGTGYFTPGLKSKDGRYEMTRPPVDMARASNLSTLAAIPEASLEFLGLNLMMKGIRGVRPLLRTTLIAIEQAFQEAGQQASEEIMAKLGWDRPGTRTEIAQRIGYSALLGMILGVPAGGISNFALNASVKGDLMNKADMTEKEADEFIEKVNKRVVEQGQDEAEQFINSLFKEVGIEQEVEAEEKVSFQAKSPAESAAKEEALKQWEKLKDLIPNSYQIWITDVADQDFNAFTDFVNKVILLTKGASKTTVPHEVFHVAYETLINEQDKQTLSDEVFIKTGLSDPLEVEEYLAERFADHWLGREEKIKSIGGRIEQFVRDTTTFLKNFFLNRGSIKQAFNEILNKGLEVKKSEREKLGLRFQKGPSAVARAIESGNKGMIIRLFGGFSFPDHLKGEVGEGPQFKKNMGKLLPYLKRDAQGLDELLQELKSFAPHLFGEYDTDSDLLSAIVSGRFQATKAKKGKSKEDELIRQVEEAEHDVERFARELLERGESPDAIQEIIRRGQESANRDSQFNPDEITPPQGSRELGDLDFDEEPVDFDQIKPPEGPGKQKDFLPPPPKSPYYKRFGSQKPGRRKSEIETGLESVLTPIASRLGRLDPRLKAKLRQFEQNILLGVQRNESAALPFLKGYRTLSEEEKKKLDLALANSNIAGIKAILEPKKLFQAYEQARTALEDLFRRLGETGFESGYLKDYWPRRIIDRVGLMEYYRKSEIWPALNEALERKAMILGRQLTEDEAADLIDALLRGFVPQHMKTGKPGNLKERQVEKIHEGTLKFYDNSSNAILEYIRRLNEFIEARRFFGESARGTEINQDSLDESVGAFVLKLLQDGIISGRDAQEISNILTARFQKGVPNGVISAIRNLSYIDTMGSPISALTQIQDIALSLFKNGYYVGPSLLKMLTRQKTLTREDIGVERIAQEFAESSKSAEALRLVFKYVGLEAMDTLGKNLLIQSAFEKYSVLAKNPTAEFNEQMDLLFGEDAKEVKDDLIAGEVTDEVKFLLFSELSDVQPISQAEMPEQYLRHPNGRLFYMLKTYTLKQIDLFRNEVFDKYAKGQHKEATLNLIRLCFFLMLMGAGADALKNLLLGRPTELKDLVVDNIVKLFGFSKYTIYQARRESFSDALKSIIFPPFRFIDSLVKDADSTMKDGFDPNEWRMIQSIPVGGKLYYWWFGRGRTQIEASSGSSRRGSRRSGRRRR